MLVGLIGFKQVGKSTAASYLQDKYGFVRHNFKDALVEEMKERFPDLLEEFACCYFPDDLGMSGWNRLFFEKPPAMRALMQNYGTNVRRFDEDSYWTDKWVEGLLCGDVVVDDVRFKNEAAAVKGRGGVLIRLVRPDVSTGGQHVSETEQLDIVADHTIECVAGDHGDLYKKLDAIVLDPHE